VVPTVLRTNTVPEQLATSQSQKAIKIASSPWDNMRGIHGRVHPFSLLGYSITIFKRPPETFPFTFAFNKSYLPPLLSPACHCTSGLCAVNFHQD